MDPERPEYQRITLTYDYNAKVPTLSLHATTRGQ